MKRSLGGGSARGPVGPSRQRRAIRFVQILLIAIAAALLSFAGFAFGELRGYETGRRAGEVGAPRSPSIVQTVVLGVLGFGVLGAAVALQGRGGVRIPTPARLDELAGRAEQAAVVRAEELAGDKGEH